MKKILQKESPVLRKTALDIPVSAITSTRIKKIITEMKKALDSQDDGVAIAAPQLGYSLRMFVISGKVGSLVKKKKKDEIDVVQGGTLDKRLENSVYINPVIKKVSKEKMVMEEGCLSVRYLYGKVSRAKKTTIKAYDENRKKFTKGASGLLAQIFQHEIDHLNGVLFIDKAKNIQEIMPPKNEKTK